MIQIVLAKSIGMIAMIISLIGLATDTVSEGGCSVLFFFGNIILASCEYLQYVSVTRHKSDSLAQKYDDLVKMYNRLAQENREYEITIRTLGSVGNGDYIRIIGTLSDVIEDSLYEKTKSKLPADSPVEDIIIACVKDLVSETKTDHE